MKALGKVKEWGAKKFSLSFQWEQQGNKYSEEHYGYKQSNYSDRKSSDIKFSLARHTLSENSLRNLKKLQEGQKGQANNLSSTLVKKFENLNGKDFSDLIQEAQKELNINDDTKKLYALSQIVKKMGAEVAVVDNLSRENRHELVIYIDANCKDPEKAIKTILRGLGINSETQIQNAINKFNKKEKINEKEQNITREHPKKKNNQKVGANDAKPDSTDDNLSTSDKGADINTPSSKKTQGGKDITTELGDAALAAAKEGGLSSMSNQNSEQQSPPLTPHNIDTEAQRVIKR